MTLTVTVDYTNFGELDMHPPMHPPMPEPEPDPEPNIELLRQVLKQIEAEPERWNQRDWATITAIKTKSGAGACGTAFCVGGWAVLLSGEYEIKFTGWSSTENCVQIETGEELYIETQAQELLGLTHLEAAMLFDSENDLVTVYEVAAQIAARAGVVL